MVDITQLLANGAQTNADFNFGKINDAYYKGRDEAAKNDQRDLFKGGLPIDKATGQPDFAAMGKALFQTGAFDQGVAATNLALQQQKLKYGQDTDASVNPSPGQPPPQQPQNLPPSVNRNAPVAVAPALASGGAKPQGQGDQPGSIVGLVSAAGVPDELAGPIIAQVSAMTKTDPNAALNPEMAPRVQQVVQAAAQRMKAGQPQQPTGLTPQGPQAQPQAPQPQAPQPGSTAPMVPTPVATQAVQPQVPPQSGATDPRFVGLVPAGRSPDVQVHLLQRAIDSGNLPPEQVKSYQNAIDAIRKAAEPTAEEKSLFASQRNPKMDERSAQQKGAEAAAVDDAKLSSAKYQTFVDAGVKAQQEIPQLEMLQEQMKDPNFFSGAGEKYNLLYKRLKSAIGSDPDAAVPQEFLRKAVAASVLGSFGALKGLGPIRVAEMNLAKTAAAAPENSIPANKLLIELQKRTYQRQADIAELAQNYKEQNGSLDPAFDKQVTAYFKSHPMFNDAEIKDFHKAIGEAPKAQQGTTPAKFGSPSEVHAAVAAGTLKKGDTFTDPNGVKRIVP